MNRAPVYQGRRVLVFSLIAMSPCGSGERAGPDSRVGSILDLSVPPGRLNESRRTASLICELIFLFRDSMAKNYSLTSNLSLILPIKLSNVLYVIIFV